MPKPTLDPLMWIVKRIDSNIFNCQYGVHVLVDINGREIVRTMVDLKDRD